MKFSPQHLDELNLLIQFDVSSAATGMKVHSDAPEALKPLHSDFTKRLWQLTRWWLFDSRRIEMAELTQRLLHVLTHA
ncbi:TIGR02647 family protein [Vibrio metschnikovii]